MKTEITVCKNYNGVNKEKVEEKYDAKYMGDFCLKMKDGSWGEKPASIFYVENPDIEKGHTHYFGIFNTFKLVDGEVKYDKTFITKGDSAFEDDLVGAVADNGEIVISCFRHDYVESKDKSVFIDGGRDYVRHTLGCKLVKIKVEKDQFIINEQ